MFLTSCHYMYVCASVIQWFATTPSVCWRYYCLGVVRSTALLDVTARVADLLRTFEEK